MYVDLVGLMESVSVSETSEDSQICDALAREQAEQEELCDILSRFYDIIRPEEEKVRMKVFFWNDCITCITSVYFFFFLNLF